MKGKKSKRKEVRFTPAEIESRRKAHEIKVKGGK